LNAPYKIDRLMGMILWIMFLGTACFDAFIVLLAI
jgi:hypothetical protein